MVFVLFTLSGLVEVFCVQESKIGSEAYMSGCRHKKSDLKPKHFCARIKKKKRSEATNICVQIKQRDKCHGAHFNAASDHKVVPC